MYQPSINAPFLNGVKFEGLPLKNILLMRVGDFPLPYSISVSRKKLTQWDLNDLLLNFAQIQINYFCVGKKLDELALLRRVIFGRSRQKRERFICIVSIFNRCLGTNEF